MNKNSEVVLGELILFVFFSVVVQGMNQGLPHTIYFWVLSPVIIFNFLRNLHSFIQASLIYISTKYTKAPFSPNPCQNSLLYSNDHLEVQCNIWLCYNFHFLLIYYYYCYLLFIMNTPHTNVCICMCSWLFIPLDHSKIRLFGIWVEWDT